MTTDPHDVFVEAVGNQVIEFIHSGVQNDDALFDSLSDLSDKEGVVNCLNQMAIEFRNKKRFELALLVHKIGVDFAKKDGEKNNANLSNALNHMGVTYEEMKDTEKALDIYREALDIAIKADHPHFAMLSLGNIANVFRGQKNYSEAESYYRQVLKLSLEQNDSVSEIQTLRHLIVISRNQGLYSQTAQYLHETIACVEKLNSEKKESVLDEGLKVFFSMIMPKTAASALAGPLPWKTPTSINLWRNLLLESIREWTTDLVARGKSTEAIKFADVLSLLISQRGEE